MQFEETRIEKMILNLLTYKILSLSLSLLQIFHQ